MTSTGLTLQVWADIRCPWCWMGHRRLGEAIRRSGVTARIEHRSFLLEPQGPETGRRLIAEVAVSEWGLSTSEWAARRDRIEQSANADGLSIHIDSARTIDSRDAHRVLKLVAATGLDSVAAWEAMFAAHLEHNHDLEDWENLARLGAEAGLGRTETLALAESDDFSTEVLADHHEAQARGIHAVPTVVIGKRDLSGARSVSELEALLHAAATETVF